MNEATWRGRVKIQRKGAIVRLRLGSCIFEANMQVERAAQKEYYRIAGLDEAALKSEWFAWTRCAS